MRITTAWQRTSPEVTVKGCKKCCVSNAVDQIDDNMLWNESEEAGNIRSERVIDKGIDCVDGDSDIDG